MRRIIIVALLFIAVACSAGDDTAAPTTSTSSTLPLASRLAACDEKINIVKNNVQVGLEQTGPNAVLTEGTPAGAAAKIRAETASLDAMIDNFDRECQPPECPTAYTPFIEYMRALVEQIASMATILEGGQDATPPPQPPGELTC